MSSPIGIACTATFTLWTMGVFPGRSSVPFDLYYTAMIGNLLMFVVGFAMGLLLPSRTPPAPELTVWKARH